MRETICDRLENRVLFAVTATQNGRTVEIIGTSGNDNVQIERYGDGRVRINDVNGNNPNLLIFNARSVRTYTFAGDAGDDNLSMGRVPGKLIANGGEGNDSISASRGGEYADSLVGDDGNDYLFGGPGDDTLGGGNGYDNMLGAEGNDYMFANSDRDGDDTLNGAEGFDTVDFAEYDATGRGVRIQIDDTIPNRLLVDDVLRNGIDKVIGTGFDDIVYAGSGRDRLVDLGRGNDRFYGGRGNETVYGGRGNDLIETYAGNDVIVDDVGTNTLNGGSGDDDVNGTNE